MLVDSVIFILIHYQVFQFGRVVLRTYGKWRRCVRSCFSLRMNDFLETEVGFFWSSCLLFAGYSADSSVHVLGVCLACGFITSGSCLMIWDLSLPGNEGSLAIMLLKFWAVSGLLVEVGRALIDFRPWKSLSVGSCLKFLMVKAGPQLYPHQRVKPRQAIYKPLFEAPVCFWHSASFIG